MKGDAFFEDYCIGYFEEVYWVLDPIEEEEVRNKIINFFNEKFPQSNSLNFNLYYNSSTWQFIFDDQNTDHSQFIEVNYPNFEIILLIVFEPINIVNLVPLIFSNLSVNICPRS